MGCGGRLILRRSSRIFLVAFLEVTRPREAIWLIFLSWQLLCGYSAALIGFDGAFGEKFSGGSWIISQ